MRLRNFYLFVFLLAVSLIAVWYFLKSNGGIFPSEDAPVVLPEVSGQLIEQDWISFTVPKEIVVPAVEVKMDVLKPMDSINVNWKNSPTNKTDEYLLKSFKADSSEAVYKIDPVLGNLLPGMNTYEIIGLKESQDGAPGREYRISFAINFDLKNYFEIRPSFFTFYPYPTETDSSAVDLKGSLTSGVQQIRFYSFHEKTGQASFTVLNKYVPLEKKFEYFIDEKFENFAIGNNEFVVEATDDTGTVVARKYFTILSTKLTLEDEIKNLFGEFQMIKGGWYVSSVLPWFSFRPAYDSVWIPEEEGKVVLPRPSLMYTVESSLATDLCEYLKSVDYERENYSYKGYSYETCQKFSRGVSVYDRFLSVLEYQPFELVKRTEYKDVDKKASSALVMIETGGMKEKEGATLFDSVEDSFSDPALDPASNPDMKEKVYYIYQMLITRNADYLDDKVGDIAVEISAEQQEEIEKVKLFLSKYSGEELFKFQIPDSKFQK